MLLEIKTILFLFLVHDIVKIDRQRFYYFRMKNLYESVDQAQSTRTLLVLRGLCAINFSHRMYVCECHT